VIEFFGEPIDVAGFRHLQNFVFLPVVDSTNAIGRGWIDYADTEEVVVEPIAICGLEQTAGRGRREKVWRSPRGGLYLTFVLRVPSKTVLAHLPLAAALWGAEACSRAFGLAVQVKWPNDLLHGGRKLGGILTEVKTRGEDTHAVVGFGINVFENAATESETGATAAERESIRKPSVGSAFLELCRQFDGYLADPDTSGVVDEWRRRTIHRDGDPMTVCLDSDDAARSVEGTFEGVTEEGFLRLKTESGKRVVTTGEVRSW
jgi:biotin-[acetyl-CoA-carboxylase] ligase BirA-like protein